MKRYQDSPKASKNNAFCWETYKPECEWAAPFRTNIKGQPVSIAGNPVPLHARPIQPGSKLAAVYHGGAYCKARP